MITVKGMTTLAQFSRETSFWTEHNHFVSHIDGELTDPSHFIWNESISQLLPTLRRYIISPTFLPRCSSITFFRSLYHPDTGFFLSQWKAEMIVNVLEFYCRNTSLRTLLTSQFLYLTILYIRSCMVCTLRPVLLGWSKQGGWDGRGMWRARGRWRVHTTIWLGGLKGGDH
jgi:hypothetical protein